MSVAGGESEPPPPAAVSCHEVLPHNLWNLPCRSPMISSLRNALRAFDLWGARGGRGGPRSTENVLFC